MYGEHFDIPAPDELVFVSWFPGGEVFRSGCCFRRGAGRIFYFRPGHETYPTYHQPLSPAGDRERASAGPPRSKALVRGTAGPTRSSASSQPAVSARRSAPGGYTDSRHLIASLSAAIASITSITGSSRNRNTARIVVSLWIAAMSSVSSTM